MVQVETCDPLTITNCEFMHFLPIPTAQAHLCRALYDDLRKNKTEAKMMECDHIVNEVRGCLRDIRQWMKPRPKRKQLANALDGVMVSQSIERDIEFG